MFNVATIVESVRRHLIPIIVIAIVALGAGVATSLMRTSSETTVLTNTAYTAEAVVYVTNDHVDASLVKTEGDRIITDARHTVVGDAVAGEIRREYGEEITITSPFWVDSQTAARLYSNYVFVDVSAPSKELALEICNKTAELAAEKMKETLPISNAEVAETAYLRSSDTSKAAVRGTDEIDQIQSATEEQKSIEPKKMVIFGFVGIFGSIFLFACYDILTRRVRSARDIERLTDVACLASLRTDEDYARTAAAMAVLMERNGLKRVVVAGASSGDKALAVADKLKSAGAEQLVVDAVSFGDSETLTKVAQVDTVLLVFAEGASSGVQIDEALKGLRVADVPVLGAVYVPKKQKAL